MIARRASAATEALAPEVVSPAYSNNSIRMGMAS